MCPESVPPPPTSQDWELIHRAADLTTHVRTALVEAVRAYVQMAPAERELSWEQRVEASRELERLAEVYRKAEVFDLEALGERFLPSAARDLLGAIEDSWILALAGSSRETADLVSAVEASERYSALVKEDGWGCD